MIHLYIPDFDAWIGAWEKYNDDKYYWLDGTPVRNGYTNWKRGQPNSRGSSNHTYMCIGPLGWWYDSSPQLFYYMCEVVY